MNVLHLSTYDSLGGAARAALRLHLGLNNIGVESQMLVAVNDLKHASVTSISSRYEQGITRLRSIIDALPLKLYTKRKKSLISPAWLPEKLSKKIDLLNPDIINLHWVCNGFMRIEMLREINKPIIWTLHDMWPFTGGCHYDDDCGKYQIECGRCPQIGSERENDFSRWVWRRKKKGWKDLSFTIIAPSRWLSKCASTSSLFRQCRIEVIPNGLDPNLYKPIDKRIGRKLLSLPQDKKIILFGGMNASGDKRKGFRFLSSALEILKRSNLNADMVIFGETVTEKFPDIGCKTHVLGNLQDDLQIAMAYGVADVFLAPSTQDNLPNTVMEALACGTPCVAFDIGGMPDMIEHKKNGYLAKPYEPEDLARGIEWILAEEKRHQSLSREARLRVENEFDMNFVAQKYLDLYKSVLLAK